MAVVSGVSVQKEYEKLKNVKPEDIQNLMEWLSKQPHLPHQYITELEVILAYHSCACDTEITKRIIDVNYTLKTLFPFYQDRKMDERLELALETWLIYPLPTLTKKGYRSIYCELLDADTKKFVYSDVIKVFLMVMDLWQYEEGTVPGVAIIVNLEGVTLGHISKINLAAAQQFFYFLQEAMFVCLKEFHFINAPTFVDKLLAMVNPFMKDDLRDMLKVHQADSNTLDNYVVTDLFEGDKKALRGKEILQQEYETSLLVDDLKNSMGIILNDISNKLRNNQKFFDDEARKRVNESKRSGGPKTLSTFFPGIEDSFKKLEID